jgi:hypothetical protein
MCGSTNRFEFFDKLAKSPSIQTSEKEQQHLRGYRRHKHHEPYTKTSANQPGAKEWQHLKWYRCSNAHGSDISTRIKTQNVESWRKKSARLRSNMSRVSRTHKFIASSEFQCSTSHYYCTTNMRRLSQAYASGNVSCDKTSSRTTTPDSSPFHTPHLVGVESSRPLYRMGCVQLRAATATR